MALALFAMLTFAQDTDSVGTPHPPPEPAEQVADLEQRLADLMVAVEDLAEEVREDRAPECAPGTVDDTGEEPADENDSYGDRDADSG